MNILNLNYIFEIANNEIGQHFYWNLGGFEVHGQVLINSWIVIALISFLSFSTTRDLKKIPEGGQNVIELITEFVSYMQKLKLEKKFSFNFCLFLFLFWNKNFMKFSNFFLEFYFWFLGLVCFSNNFSF